MLRPLRGREPEGLWNLLSIVREMFRRNDDNALHLLEVLTEEAVACDQVYIIYTFVIFTHLCMFDIVYYCRSWFGGLTQE